MHVFRCHCTKMRMSALKSDSIYALPHLDIYCSYIQIRVDVKVFSSTLCRQTQQRDGGRPGSTFDYTDMNTTRIRTWACKKDLCFLLWSRRCECPVSLAGLLGVQSTGEQQGMQRALYHPLLNFLLGVKQTVEEDRSIDFTSGLIYAITNANHSQRGNLRTHILPALSCLGTSCCWPGQELLATLVGSPMLGKSHYCLQTCS